MTADDLPPLPEPYEGATRWIYYDADQMRAYARGAIAQAVESETSDLRAQVALLTADAGRYRLVRTHDAFDIRVVGYGKRFGKGLDDLADAILTTKENGNG